MSLPPKLLDCPLTGLRSGARDFVNQLQVVCFNHKVVMDLYKLKLCQFLKGWTTEFVSKSPGFAIGFGIGPGQAADVADVEPSHEELECRRIRFR